MELNITHFFTTAAPMDYSASVAEIGEGAGAATWGAAVGDSPDFMVLDTDGKREAFKDHVREFGAWTEKEVDNWSTVELNALLLQMIAGDMRENNLTPDTSADEWAAYEADGSRVHEIFRATDGEVYYYIGG